MITFEHVSVQYADAPAPSLHDVTLEIPEGEMRLLGSSFDGAQARLAAELDALH